MGTENSDLSPGFKPLTRWERFERMGAHPFHGKTFKRLTVADLKIAREFIDKHEVSNRNQFSSAVNRWFIDDPDKPKNYRDIWALMSNVASEEFITLPKWRADRVQEDHSGQ